MQHKIIILYPLLGVYIHLRGKNYTNNSIISISDIGEEETALQCITDLEGCCGTRGQREGEFYYPNNTRMPIKIRRHSLYRDRTKNMIRLNRNTEVMGNLPIAEGRYRCEVRNATEMLQVLYFTLSMQMI